MLASPTITRHPTRVRGVSRLLPYNPVSTIAQKRAQTQGTKRLSIVQTLGRDQEDSRPGRHPSPEGTWAESGTFSSQGRERVRSAIFPPSILRSPREWSGCHLAGLGYRNRPIREGWIRNTVLRPSNQPENARKGQRISVEGRNGLNLRP